MRFNYNNAAVEQSLILDIKMFIRILGHPITWNILHKDLGLCSS